MSIRKVTSTLSDAKYIRALEKELKENRIFRENVLPRLEAVEKRPRAAGNRALIPRAPVGLSCSVTPARSIGALDAGINVTATFAPVTRSINNEPIAIARNELYATPKDGSVGDTGGVFVPAPLTPGTYGIVALSESGKVCIATRLEVPT